MKFRLLIVDDSKILCSRLVEMFSEYKNLEIVGQAHDVRSAIESVDRTKPDATILDIRMPGGNGLDCLEHIKKNDPSAKVIIFTNYPYLQYRKKCLDKGADYFFGKHSEFDKLYEVIGQLIQLHNTDLKSE